MNVRQRIEELAARVLAFVRSVPPANWVVAGVGSAVVLAVFTGWVVKHRDENASVRRHVAHAVRAARMAASEVTLTRPLAPAPKDSPPSVSQLVAQTRAPTCAERSEAAGKLAGSHNPRAIAALRSLAKSSFRDESPSPGIFSCSSRRAAQKALEQSGS